MPLTSALAPGDRLGPYEILGPIGAGGMGEVYRARDPRLRRDVALKVVRASLSNDPEHVERLTREARAVGRLNHPNIVAVFDVGAAAGVPYVVSELLQGESLRERLARGPLPFRKAIEYGIQLAEALGAAHDRGICHRDVKPGNVFITTDGRVKLLDFGLAKRALPVQTDPDDSTASASEPDGWRGTAGYMSPEQILGTALDQRSDIFALGAVLYEMLTGERAFPRKARTDPADAVLTAEPVDPRELKPGLPDPVVALVRRCLEKNRDERYQSARDLAFHLQQVHQIIESSKPVPAFFRRARAGRGAWILALPLLAAAAIAFVAGRTVRQPPSAPAFSALTFRRGRIGGARFNPEAQAVVYSEALPVHTDTGQRNRLELWRVDLAESPQSRALGLVDAEVLAVGAGQLALSLHPRYVNGRRFVGTLALAAVDTAPREIATEVDDADWDPANGRFAVARRTGTAGETRLEYPEGTVLYTTRGSVRSPRISPDGTRVAFLDDPTGHGTGGRVVVVATDRRRSDVTEDLPNVRGLAWSPRGDEVWFAAAQHSRSDRSLRAVSLSGQQRDLMSVPGSLTLWDVARDGRVLVSRDEEWNALVGSTPGWSGERDISWSDAAGIADLSDDGQTVLFGDRFGIYLRRVDESVPIDLGVKDAYADDLSPDGKWVLATNQARTQLIVVPTGAGEQRSVPAYQIKGYRGALWCSDGRRIVFNAVEGNEDLRSYVQDVSAATPGAPRPLTPPGTWVLAVSGDGKWGAATSATHGVSLWPLDGGSSRELPGSQPDDRPVAFQGDGRFLWVFRRGEVPAPVFRIDIQTGRREPWKMLLPPDPAGVYSIINFKITPSGDTYFYSYAGVLSQLYLVRGLR